MRALVAVDSSVIVAALVTWHERHKGAAAAVEGALARKSLVVPSAALIDAYSILTRLPAQHRLAHADAFHLLRSSFGGSRVVGVATRETWSLLRRWSVAAVGGGDAYDALVVDAARAAGAKTLLSLRKFVATGIEIVEPV